MVDPINKNLSPAAKTPPVEPKEPITEPNDQKQDESKSPPQQAPRDWEKSFKGLQQKTQVQAEQLNTIADTLAAIQKGLATPEDAQQSEPPESIEGQLVLLSQQVTGLSTRLEEEQSLRQEKELETRKLQMLSVSPDLLPFADTIATLPDPEAQAEAIELFANRLTAFSDAKKSPATTPPRSKTPSQSQPSDPQVVLETAQKAWASAVESKASADVIAKARSEFMAASDKSNYLTEWAYQDR